MSHPVFFQDRLGSGGVAPTRLGSQYFHPTQDFRPGLSYGVAPRLGLDCALLSLRAFVDTGQSLMAIPLFCIF
jgi:hypothetical protein